MQQNPMGERRIERIQENIAEYMADLFCTITLGLELLKKHIAQQPASPTCEADREIVNDLTHQVDGLENAVRSLLNIMNNEKLEKYASLRPLAIGDWLKVFCERTNWEMEAMGQKSRVHFVCACPDDCVRGDALFAESALIDIALGMLWGSGMDLEICMERDGENEQIRFIAQDPAMAEKIRTSLADSENWKKPLAEKGMRLAQDACCAMGWQITVEETKAATELTLRMKREKVQAAQVRSLGAAMMEDWLQRRVHSKMKPLFDEKTDEKE